MMGAYGGVWTSTPLRCVPSEKLLEALLWAERSPKLGRGNIRVAQYGALRTGTMVVGWTTWVGYCSVVPLTMLTDLRGSGFG